MRVTHTIASLEASKGGPSRSVPALVAALRNRGIDIDLCTGPPRLEHSALLHDHGIWLWNNHRAATLARDARLPRIVSVRGMLAPWALRHHSWRKNLAWRVYQRRDLADATAIHATSEEEARNVRSAGLRNAVAVIPNGVEIPPAPSRPTGPRQSRRALFLSRIHPKKGLPMLIDAWARVRPADWELVLAGPDEGGHRRQLEQLIAASRLEDEVRFSGPVQDPWPVYATADVFVLPTHSENFALVVAEALASSVPVITTKGAPWRDLVDHRCGWWTDISAESLAQALREATTLSDVERQEMGARGRSLMATKFSWDSAASAMKELYEWVLGHRPVPSFVET